MIFHIDPEVEGERIKKVANDVLVNGNAYRPMLILFERGNLKATIEMRNLKASSDNDSDAAFSEMCSLIPFFHADEAIVSFTASAMKDGEPFSEGLCVMAVSDSNALSQVFPYEVDQEGTFQSWIELEEEEMKKIDFNPRDFAKSMVASLAHFMTTHLHLEYSGSMVRALSKKGHMICIVHAGELLTAPDADDVLNKDKMLHSLHDIC